MNARNVCVTLGLLLAVVASAPADLQVLLRDARGNPYGQPIPVPPGGWAAVVEVAKDQPPAPADAARMLAAHNKARAAAGLPAYRLSPELCDQAQAHSRDMAAWSSLNHDGWLGRLKAAGYGANGSENVAWASFDQTPEDVTQVWLDSKVGHRENVLSAKWRDAGFGVAKSAKGEPYWCAIYGAK